MNMLLMMTYNPELETGELIDRNLEIFTSPTKTNQWFNKDILVPFCTHRWYPTAHACVSRMLDKEEDAGKRVT